jgi:hypothetical protein
MAQLVLQFATTEGLDSYDKLIRFEKTLIPVLGKSAEVDGHDFGSSEINIFILTEDPLRPSLSSSRQTSSHGPARR